MHRCVGGVGTESNPRERSTAEKGIFGYILIYESRKGKFDIPEKFNKEDRMTLREEHYNEKQDNEKYFNFTTDGYNDYDCCFCGRT